MEEGESIEEGAARELSEESGILARSLNRLGYIVFNMKHLNKVMRVHIFDTTDFDLEPVESEEMRPQWYKVEEIPFERMWPDDEHWFHYMLSSQSFIGRYVTARMGLVVCCALNIDSRFVVFVYIATLHSFTFEDDETITDFSLRAQ